jgi:choline kinase/phosphatidylglycerophosphate synthase
VSTPPPHASTAAVVLAAGLGSRLNHGPKPLKRVAGRTLLERAVTALQRAQVGPIIVVVGHAKEEIERFVAERGLDVELVENGDFHVGNGSSALAGGRAAASRFVVVMADHIFDADTVRRVLASPEPFAIAVDRDPRFCDVDEATKVLLCGGRVTEIGRDLDPCDGVDAGLAVCDPEVLATAERALGDGGGTWNDVKRRWLAEGRELAAADVTGAAWVDVDTPADVVQAERLLVRQAAGKQQDGLVSRRLNRPLSWRLSLLFLRAGLSPNAVTGIAFGLTVAAAAVLGLGHEWPLALVAGGILVHVASVVDGCDGEVARASLRSSPSGAFLDSVLDRVGDAAILVGLAVAAGFGTATLVLLVAALVTSALVPYVKASYEASFGRPLPPPPLAGGFGRDARLLTVAVFAIVMQPLAALAATALLASFEVGHRLVSVYRALAGERALSAGS